MGIEYYEWARLSQPVFPAFPEARRPLHLRIAHKVQDFLDELNIPRLFYKTLAYSYVLVILWCFYLLVSLPQRSNHEVQQLPDDFPVFSQEFDNYYETFKVSSGCHLREGDLYIAPNASVPGKDRKPFCATRKELLTEMSKGETRSPNTPWVVPECHYHWYSMAEICMILGRFDTIIFVGDTDLQNIYNGFNILLRKDLVKGTLATWDMDWASQSQCLCEKQFSRPFCAGSWVTSSEQVPRLTRGLYRGNPYICDRSTTHAFLRHSPASTTLLSCDVLARFKALLDPPIPRPRSKRVAVIYSASPVPVSLPTDLVLASMLEFKKALFFSRRVRRSRATLWVGPGGAAGPRELDADADAELRAFDDDMADAARRNGIDVLSMRNLTARAWGPGGPRSAEKLAITQAMMVFNWLDSL
ncbi:hypothetical protein ABEF95_006467 [Exophiala dermatitidis]